MTKRNFLSGVGILALAGALGTAPVNASNGEAGASAPIQERFGDRWQWRFDLIEAGAPDIDDSTDPAITSEPAVAVARIVAPVAPVAVPIAAPAVGAATPVDTFAGFQNGQYIAAFENSMSLALPRFEGNIVATVTRPDPQIISRDDVGLAGSVDVNNTQPSVVQLFRQNNLTGGIFFNCTGTVINPRTILTAAHCINSSPSESYGLPGAAGQAILISSGVDSSTRFFNYLDFGSGYNEGGVATSTDVVIHSSSNLENGGLRFPWADIALIALDAPITDVPSLPILLTPLTELTHVVQVGYGGFGTGSTGNIGIGFLRRVGENMLGAIASVSDIGDSIFPGFAPTSDFGFETQIYYFTDFDNPDRTQAELDGCTFTPGGISCANLAAIRAIDYFDDDALPNEVATAGGDSGSPLIVDQLYDFPIITAVLSGGFDFFRVGDGFGDISFYNPLYPFFEFLSENTAYKYVSAAAGDGVWSDPTRWTQELDPGFFIDDGTGTLVNGIPVGSERGVFEGGPKLGTIVGIDVSGNSTAPANLPPEGTPNFGANTPNSSVLLGPGSTGFVPQNTDGTPGVAFSNPAQYFEVFLNRSGTTTVDLDVEIDKLIIDNDDAGFVLPSAWEFTSNIGVEQFAGSAQIDGTLNTPIYTLGAGELSGDGEINTNVLFNLNGLLSAGGTQNVGSLEITGDYVQTSGGALWADFSVTRRGVIADSYTIGGAAVLGGELVLFTGDARPRFGSTFTVLEAGVIDGDFSTVTFITRSPILTAQHRIEGNQVIVEVTARSIRDVVGSRSTFGSLGGALDTLRTTGRYTQFSNLFAVVDGAGVDTFGATLASLAPVSAFSQSFTATNFSQRFTGQIAQRTLALRGADRAAGGFSAAGNAAFALTGTTPAQTGQLGVFGSASGVYLNASQQSGILGNGSLGFDTFGTNGVSSGTIGANAFEQASLVQAGEMTVGADLRVSDEFSFGVAVSNIRNSELSNSALRPQEDRSQSVAIYATYGMGGAFADVYAGASNQNYGVERSSQGDFEAQFANAVGAASGDQAFGGMRLGYAFDVAKGIEVGPVVSMDYVRNNIGGFDELGAGSLGLSVADRTFTSMGAKAGAMASFDILTGDTSSVRAFGSVAYARELADTQDVVTAHFFGAADTTFTIANQLDPQWVSVNAGAEMAVGNNVRASLSVSSEMGRGVLSNDQGRFTLSWQF